MQAIQIITILVISFCITPLFVGIDRMLYFKVFNSSLSKTWKKVLIITFSLVLAIIPLCLLFITYEMIEKYKESKLCDYICVLIYTALLALYSNTKLYLSPKEEVKTAKQAFKEGFTRANVNNIFTDFPLKTLINFIYLSILICAQIEELGLCVFPKNLSYFLTLNKYGLVIVFAIEKMFTGIKPDKERSKIMLEKFVEKEKEEDERRKETRENLKRLRTKRKKNSSKTNGE